MLHQTFHFLLKLPLDKNLTGFVFFSTLCSYSFHWYFTSHSVIQSDRIAWLKKYRSVISALFFIGLIGSIVFFYYLFEYWVWLIPAVVATFLYSAPKTPNKYLKGLRKVAFGKTFFLTFVWTYVTSVLPVVIRETNWTIEYTLYALGRFFLIYCICILFDYRDREDDKEAGLRSLITHLNEKNITRLFIFSFLLFIASSFGLLYYNHSALTITMLLIPGIIVAMLYNHARKDFSDLLYYFVLDGLMAFSAILMLITCI